MGAEETCIQGIPVSALVERFGTSLFVYDAEVLVDTFRTLRELSRNLKLTIIVDTWVSDHYGDPHAEAHPHHPAA